MYHSYYDDTFTSALVTPKYTEMKNFENSSVQIICTEKCEITHKTLLHLNTLKCITLKIQCKNNLHKRMWDNS